MIRNSLKQLFRKPGKALLFFLLMSLATALLVFAAVSMVQTNQRIDAAESQFTTIGTVSQVLEPGDKLMFAGQLNFEGADYVNPPETRPYYMAHTPDARGDTTFYKLTRDSTHIVEFTALESGGSRAEMTKIRIEKIHFERFDDENYNSIVFDNPEWREKRLEVGEEVYLTQEWMRHPIQFEAGTRYMSDLYYEWGYSEDAGTYIYELINLPFSTQYDPATGEEIKSSIFPETEENWQRRADIVTEDFWEPGGLGEVWMEWIEQLQLWDMQWLPVIPTNGVQLLPSFHAKEAYVDMGRAITQEEFDSGALVCMISDYVAQSGVRVGDKINLPMSMALYGYRPGGDSEINFEFSNPFSVYRSLNAQGKPYDVFFEAEYQVVGIYRQLYPHSGELFGMGVIVPSKSITASDADNVAYYRPMNTWSTSFQIPNGKIAEFNAALHSAVPEASKLEITYDDNGYEDVMHSLKNARLSSMLLLGVGVLAALTVVILLLYFFVLKERKRTAIERSLGMSKARCRVSLLAGVMALALPAVAAGSWGSWLFMSGELALPKAEPAAKQTDSQPEIEVGDMSLDEDMETADIENVFLSRDYSLWAVNEHDQEAEIELDEGAYRLQNLLYFAVPLGMFLTVLLLALLMVNRNLRIEPILLMGSKEE